MYMELCEVWTWNSLINPSKNSMRMVLFYQHCKDEDTEPQSFNGLASQSYSNYMAKPGFEQRLPDP